MDKINEKVGSNAKSSAEDLAESKKTSEQINSGLDPQQMMDAIEYSGILIEAGANKFRAYSMYMIESFGEWIAPHLHSLYMSAKYGVAKEFKKEMDCEDTIEDIDYSTLLEEYRKEKEEEKKDDRAEKQAKMLVAGTEMIGASFKLGVYKFKDIVNAVANKGIEITADLLKALKGAYGSFLAEYEGSDFDKLDDLKNIRAFQLSDINKDDEFTPVYNRKTPEVESVETENTPENTIKTEMTRDEEVQKRTTAWEEKNNKQLQELSEAEWVKAIQQIMALTETEAWEYLYHLQAKRAGNL